MKTDFPTASAGSSQAPTAAVEKSQSASNTEFQTLPALKVYVMPSSYRESWFRFFIPKRPVAASLLFESQTFKVYAYPSFRILDKEKLDRIVKQGKAFRWPDSPENTRTLSWGSWADDIQQSLKGM